ncbi:MAG: hypothetical protein ABI315_15175 [Bacteroidia bacterium]
MKKLIAIFILTLSTSVACAQGFVKMDTIDTPAELTRLLSGHINRTFQVDFDGDGFSDYICQLDFQDTTKDVYKEIWINSHYKIVKTIEKYSMDYDFFWLVNIDNDPEPEIFSAAGYSDGIDYCFIDQDIKNGKDRILLYFNPVIDDSDENYWGYPWDIKDLMIRLDNGLFKLKCSINNEIERDGEITIPDWQKGFPVICFSGHSNQPDIKVGTIGAWEWLTISEILDKVIIKDKK